MFIIILILNPEFGSASPVEINIDTPSQPVYKGQDFNINISVDPVDNPITAIQFNLLFNSSLIEVRNIKEGFLLKQKGANTIFNSGTLNNKMGTVVNVWGLIITPGASITAQGIIAGLTLNAKEAGSSKIILTNVIISNPENQAVQTVILDASVRAEIIVEVVALVLAVAEEVGACRFSGNSIISRGES